MVILTESRDKVDFEVQTAVVLPVDLHFDVWSNSVRLEDVVNVSIRVDVE